MTSEAYKRLDAHLDENYYAGARDDLRHVAEARNSMPFGDPIAMLDRMLYCMEREQHSYSKAEHIGGNRGDRYAATGGSWGEKATKAQTALRDYLKSLP